MKEGDLLFVYGTLRQGEVADLSIHAGASYVGPDAINGDIYNLGWYPGVRLGSDNVVVGDVFKLGDASVIRQIDQYEGYPSLYNRSEVETKGGLRAWVYTINRECGENERITSGDWLNQTEVTNGDADKKEAA
jgi:gamma-glutamylcyclotransferase (GGCT)/AIG2-like uncharacterized protein YtfP